jgi:hypothetical protein
MTSVIKLLRPRVRLTVYQRRARMVVRRNNIKWRFALILRYFFERYATGSGRDPKIQKSFPTQKKNPVATDHGSETGPEFSTEATQDTIFLKTKFS